MSGGDLKTVVVLISGRVQGVWFRGWTAQAASRLGLTGWVRNRRDGTVEALFSGEAGVVDDMLRRCWDGPPSSRVDQVEIQETDELPTSNEFHVRTTY